MQLPRLPLPQELTRSLGARLQLDVIRASRALRLGAAGCLLVSAVWNAYTAAYFWLHPRALTYAPSPFMHLTGRPDPTCGLTRTFAWIWHGDLGQAVAVYPLGPLAFAFVVVLSGYAIAVIASGRGVHLRLPAGWGRTLLLVGGSLLAANWTAKLLWLGV